MVSGKLAASGDYRAIRQKLNDRPFVVRIDCAEPAGARGRAARASRRSSRSRSTGDGRPARAQPRRRVAPARRCPRVAQRLGRPAHARRAARRLARERLRVPGDRGSGDGGDLRPHRPPARGQPPAVARARARLAAAPRRPCSSTSPTRPRRAPRFADDVTRDARRLGDPAARHAPVRAPSAFGNELGDRTLVYLTLKPIARWRIVAAEARRRARRGRGPGRGRAGSWRSR